MKLCGNILSIAAAAALLTGCGGGYKESHYDKVTGNVIGCLTDNDTVDEDPIVGATITIGDASATSGEDGCFAVKVTVMNGADEWNSLDRPYKIIHDKYEDVEGVFEQRAETVAGILADLGIIVMDEDESQPRLTGVNDVMYAGNMLKEGIDGKKKPIELRLDEKVILADDINDQITIELFDPATGALVAQTTPITATATVDSTGRTLSIRTSEAITEGYYVGIQIPVSTVRDAAGNELTEEIDGEHAEVNPVGANYVDTLEIWVRIFKEADLAATAITMIEQADTDTSDDQFGEDGGYAEVMTALETANGAFKNIAKNDESDPNALAITNFNNTNTDSLRDLARKITGDNGITIASDIRAKIKFTPTNANYYIVKAYDENNDSIALSAPEGTNHSTGLGDIDVSSGRVTLSPDMENPGDIEVIIGGLDPAMENTVVVTPYSATGSAGTAVVLAVKDNVAPTAALQYSYDMNDDGSTSESTTTGGVTASIYGGSGELSNGTEADTTATTYDIGTPYMEMTVNLLVDHNATEVDLGNQNGNMLPSTYTASDYTAWIADINSSRTFGVAFTEPVNVSGTPTLTKVDNTTVTGLITSATNVQDNEMVNGEHLALVTVNNIHTLVNEHNGSTLDLTAITTDLAGNAAVNGKVVLLDKVESFIVSASGVDYNSTSSSVDGIFSLSEALSPDVNGSGTAWVVVNGNWVNLNNGCIAMASDFTSLTMADCASGATQPDGNTTVRLSAAPDRNGNAPTGLWTFKTSSSTLSN